MLQAIRTTVQTWECDRMGHLNVRSYFARADEAHVLLGAHLGLPPRSAASRELGFVPLETHVRFLAELRPGAPFSAAIGVLEASDDGLTTFTEIRHEARDVPAATVTTRLRAANPRTRIPRPVPPQVLERAETLRTALPAHGAPRGLRPHAPGPEPTLDEVRALGMAEGFLGVARPELCDEHGYLTPAGHMACVSDGVPYYMVKHRPPSRPGIGGAALEYRFVYRNPAQAGEVLAVHTAPREVGERAFQLCHHVFDAVTGRCVATSEAVVVSFDLEARRAVALTPEDRAALLSSCLPQLSA